jgi:hypothetical protein
MIAVSDLADNVIVEHQVSVEKWMPDSSLIPLIALGEEGSLRAKLQTDCTSHPRFEKQLGVN